MQLSMPFPRALGPDLHMLKDAYCTHSCLLLEVFRSGVFGLHAGQAHSAEVSTLIEVAPKPVKGLVH